MPGQVVVAKETQATRDKVKLVQPSIILGLGGTGKEVLLRLRQRFYEKFGTTGFPVMRYMWIDTDVQNHNIDGKPLDYVAREVHFAADEKIDIQIKGEDFTTIFSRRSANRHIFRWMDPSLNSLGSVINGARQIRLLGRLAFFHHAYSNSDIRDRLGKARDHVRSLAVRNYMQDHYGIQVGDGLQVIIVCSLAGGTGSGTFLDTAFLVRDEFKAVNPDIVGYLVLPPVFSTDIHHAEQIYANAYAALKELEYYSMRKDMLQKELNEKKETDGQIISAHDFVAEWKPGVERKIPGPPFNTCYLINNETEGGGSIGPHDKTDLCDMIAENLFLDFSSLGFSNKKRSVRSNLDDYLTNELEYRYNDEKGNPVYSEIFSFRFSAFGLSKIYVPVDRIRKACAFKLASKLLTFWSKDNPLEADPVRFIRSDVLPELQLKLSGGTDDIRNALWIADDRGQTFLRLIEDAWQGPERSALQQKLAGKQKGIAKEFERRVLNYAQTMLATPREKEKWGGFVKRLYNANRAQWLEGIQARIRTLLRDWMNKQYFRANAAIGYLVEINRLLKEHSEYYQRASETAEQHGKEAFTRLRQYQEILSEEEEGLWLHRWSIQELIDLLCRAAADHFRHRTMSLVYRAAKEGCDDLREYIGEQTVREKPGKENEIIRRGLIQEVWSVQEDLLTLQREAEAGLSSFEHNQPHLIFENLYETGMFEQYFLLQKSGDKMIPITEEELVRLEQVFRDRAQEKFRDERWQYKSLFDLSALRDRFGLENFRGELNDFCIDQFRNLKLDIDAIQTMYQRYQKSPGKIGDIISRFAKNGRVWIKKSTEAGTDPALTTNYAENIEIGVNNKGMQHSDYKSFYNQVKDNINSNPPRGPVNPPLDVEPDAVFLYNEYAGIPLMYINRIDEYRQAYIDQIYKHNRTLHIDREEDKFQDVIIKSEKDVHDTIAINEALLVGAILRVVEISVSPDDGEVAYSYQDRSQIPPTPIPLGNKYLAVETLRRNQDLLAHIKADIIKVQRRFDLPRRQKFFTTLSYHIAGTESIDKGVLPGPFQQRWVRVGNTQIKKFDPERQAIDKVLQAEKKVLIDGMVTDAEGLYAEFVKWYNNDLNNDTEVINVEGKPLRIMKKEKVGGP